MDREEEAQLAACAACGAVVSPSQDRGYSFEPQGLVCWDCALRRGGRYDADQDRWSEPPCVADLHDEKARPG